jgi:phage I-like protein
VTTHLLDLGVSDVHTDGVEVKPKANPASTKRKKRTAKPATEKAPAMRKRLHVRAELAEGGSLHVRHHMSDRDVVLDGVAVTLADGDGKRVWIQLAKPGAFRGHPAGPFELNGKVFDEVIRNFKATENHRIPIDFEHASEADATEGSIPIDGAPAQGWIVDMKVLNGNLWGLVEWGDKAREYIRSGQYRFFSPAIRFNSRDRVTGERIGARMTSGALTNNPFLDGMKPLAAKDGAAGEVRAELSMGHALAHSSHEYMPRIRAALRLHDLSSAAECSDHLEKLRDKLDAVGGDHYAVHQGVSLADYCRPLRDLVGAVPGDTWEKVFDAVQDLIDAAIDEHNLEEHAEMADDDEGDDDGAAMSDAPNTETETMAMGDKDNKDTVVALSEAKEKVAELTLSLKEETVRADKAEAELVTLRAEKKTRDEEILTDRVNEAFETYKDDRKLADDDKEAMLIVLKSKPDLFEKRYPKVAPDKRHLMRNLTENSRENGAPTTTIDATDDLSVLANESQLQTTKRLMKDEKLSFAAAQNKASKLHSQLRGGGRRFA